MLDAGGVKEKGISILETKCTENRKMTTCESVPYVKPDAGNPQPRRGSLFYKTLILFLASACATSVALCGDAPREISVLTWNTEHYGFDRKSPELRKELERNMFELIRAANPDIFLIQETYGSFGRFKAEDVALDAKADGDELVQSLPKLPARQVGTLFFKRRLQNPVGTAFHRRPLLAVERQPYQNREVFQLTLK